MASPELAIFTFRIRLESVDLVDLIVSVNLIVLRHLRLNRHDALIDSAETLF